jgi:hypothetical protein
MADEETATAFIGDDDTAPHARLAQVLQDLGAVDAGERTWGVAGSVAVTIYDVRVAGSILHIDADNYQGIQISGPPDLVNKVAAAMAVEPAPLARRTFGHRAGFVIGLIVGMASIIFELPMELVRRWFG